MKLFISKWVEIATSTKLKSFKPPPNGLVAGHLTSSEGRQGFKPL